MEITDEFRGVLKEYFDTEKKLKEIGTEVKEWRVQKKELEDSIIKNMKAIGMSELVIPGIAKLSVGMSKQTKPLKKEDISNTLTEALGAKEAAVLMEKIFATRQTVEVEKLKKLRAPKE